MHCRIGALLGDADETFIDKMGKFGLIIGNASLIIEEFADTFDFEELQRRFENEYLPLPILHALENAKGGGEICLITFKESHRKQRLSIPSGAYNQIRGSNQFI